MYTLAAKLEVDYLNEKYNLKIPEGEYETLGGFVLANLEDIPKVDDVFVIDNYEVRILEASEQRIERVEIRLLE